MAPDEGFSPLKSSCCARSSSPHSAAIKAPPHSSHRALSGFIPSTTRGASNGAISSRLSGRPLWICSCAKSCMDGKGPAADPSATCHTTSCAAVWHAAAYILGQATVATPGHTHTQQAAAAPGENAPPTLMDSAMPSASTHATSVPQAAGPALLSRARHSGCRLGVSRRAPQRSQRLMAPSPSRTGGCRCSSASRAER